MGGRVKKTVMPDENLVEASRGRYPLPDCDRNTKRRRRLSLTWASGVPHCIQEDVVHSPSLRSTDEISMAPDADDSDDEWNEGTAPLLPSCDRTTSASGRINQRSYGTAHSNAGQGEGDNLSVTSDTQNARSWSRHQWQVLAVLLSTCCSSSLAVCLFPPFFPRLAEEKGASAAVYGFVIGTNCLTSFIMTPVIGKNMPKFGIKYAVVWGMLMGGVCCASSGFLQFFLPNWKFVVTAVFIRIVHATGNAMVVTGTFTYTAMEFENSIGIIFSLTRTAMNLAQLLGPVIGGAIYQLDGFYLPFLSMGILQFSMGMLSICVLPEHSSSVTENSEDDNKNELKRAVTISNILSIPTIWFSFLTFIVATVCNGFLSINLEPRVLRRFNLTPFYVGLLFGLKDGANSVSAPIWGCLCDKARKTTVKPYMIISAGLAATSFVLMGAGSIIGFKVEKSIPLLVITLSLNGVGIGGEQVAGVLDALHEATAAGYPNDPAMHGLIAGLWSSLSGAGRFVSRVGSGFLVDCIGFNDTAAIVTALQILIAVVTFIYMCFFECTFKRRRAAVQWRDVAIIEENRGPRNDVVVFTDTGSPSESLMGKSVSIDVPKDWRRVSKTSRSLPPARLAAMPVERQTFGPNTYGGGQAIARSLRLDF